MRSTLTSAALALLSLTFIAVAQNQTLKFEVSTIKPYQQDRTANFEYSGGSCHGTDTQYPSVNRIPPPPLGRCVLKRLTLAELIALAYRVRASGGPDWTLLDKFDVEGKVEDSSMPTEAQLFTMLRNLLADRFHLEFHREQREVQTFSLYLAKNGPRSMKKSVGDDPPSVRFGPGYKVTAKNVTMTYFANSIRGMAGGAVTDKTGLTDKYDFSFEWEQGDPGGFLSGLQSELGLRIEPLKTQTDFIIIDHAEKPDAN